MDKTLDLILHELQNMAAFVDEKQVDAMADFLCDHRDHRILWRPQEGQAMPGMALPSGFCIWDFRYTGLAMWQYRRFEKAMYCL